MANERPNHTFRIGNVAASIWKNDTATGSTFRVSLERRYPVEREGVTEWKSSNSFRTEEIPLVSKVSDLALTWILEQNGSK